MTYLTFLIPLVGIGVVVLFIVAMIQQGKSEHGGFKQAFFTVVTLVMLSLWVSGVIAVLIPTLKQFVFTQARTYQTRYNPPPSLYLPGTPNAPVTDGSVYTCADSCQFSADDKAQFASWKQQYQDWKTNHQNTAQQYRNDLVTPLSLLIVGLPLYFLFRRMMEQGSKEEQTANKKPAPLRSLYYYFVAFSGLIMAVVAVGALINTTLRVALKAQDQNAPYSTPAAVGPKGETTDQRNAIQSVLACQDQCGFSDADQQLANQWLTDYATFIDASKSKTARIQDDLSNYLPILLIGFPLFWFHFTRIRKESFDVKSVPNQTPATS